MKLKILITLIFHCPLFTVEPIRSINHGTYQIAIKKTEAAGFVSYKKFIFYPSIDLLIITTANKRGHDIFQAERTFITINSRNKINGIFATHKSDNLNSTKQTFEALQNRFDSMQ